MTRAQAVARARAACGHGAQYGLGKGGMDPRRTVPWDEEMRCDCSGLVAWALGRSRALWLSTDGWLEVAAPLAKIVPLQDAHTADLLVYGDYTDKLGLHREGHVGIVTEVGPHGPEKAVHASAGNWRRESDAILETGVDLWINNSSTVVVRPLFLTDSEVLA